MVSMNAVRGADGRLVITTSNMDNSNINGIGTASGTMSYSLGSTGANSNETVLNIGQTSKTDELVLLAANTTDNFQIYGTNIDAKFSDSPKSSYNVEWNASNSKFDSTGTTAGIVFSAGEQSANNIISLGKSSTSSLGGYDNIVVDSGKSNIYVGSTTSKNLYQTTKNSNGAAIIAGNGANVFNIGGSNGIFSGGNGNDTFITERNTANHNMFLGNDGNDVMQDYGSGTLFIGGNGNDYAGGHGKDALMYTGTSSGDTIDGSGATNSAFFKSTQLTDTNGKVYSFSDYLKLKGWTLTEFLQKSNLDNNPYYSFIQPKIKETLG